LDLTQVGFLTTPAADIAAGDKSAKNAAKAIEQSWQQNKM
jgi:hypothetical protein